MRCVEVLNRALTAAFEQREDVYLIGEDILDPGGGAFKVSRGLSTRWPDRVLTTPISEAALFGVASGMALRGLRPVLEIMFGDFLALGYDQIVNGISKFRAMYDEQVTLPLVVRLPMGGYRGYGPTHSQSLEKLLLGVPNVRVVALSELHDIGGLLDAAIADEQPVFLIENKLMYGREHQRPLDGMLGEFGVRESGGPYPALTLSGNGLGPAAATVVTYGGLVPIVRAAVEELIVAEELFCEIVVLSSLLPLDVAPVLESVLRTGALVTAEEGTLTGGFGAELTALVTSAAWGRLRHPVRRVAAADAIVPAAPALERAMLPSVADVREALVALAR